MTDYALAQAVLIEELTRNQKHEEHMRRYFARYGEYAVPPKQPGLVDRLVAFASGLALKAPAPVAAGNPEPVAA